MRVGACRHPECITIRGGRWAVVDFPALVALVMHPTRGPILFDTGYADRFEEVTAPFPERFYRWATPYRLPREETLAHQLQQRGVQLEDIRLVVVSHLHADHMSGLRDLPHARFLVLRAEVEETLPRRGVAAVRRGFLPALLPADSGSRWEYADRRPTIDLAPAWRPFERAFDLLGDRSLLGIPLPGHTPGQLGVLVRDLDDRPVFLVADACWSTRAWREQRPPSPIARLTMHDWRAYLATLAGLRRVAIDQPDLHLVPSHCAEAMAERPVAAGASR